MKRSERLTAVGLRRNGASYAELRQQFGMAKSTLWRWLKAEGLVETHPQRLTELKRIAQRKGAAVVKAQRLARTHTIMEEAAREISGLSQRDLWLLGLALYWAEGSKQKPGNVSASVIFTNSDPVAVRLMVVWFQTICAIPNHDLHFEIYLHDTADAARARRYWAEQLQISMDRLTRVRWKHHRPATRRTNVGDSYHGVVRLRVARSSALNRRITGWIAGVTNALIGEWCNGNTRGFGPCIPGSNPGSPEVVRSGS